VSVALHASSLVPYCYTRIWLFVTHSDAPLS
jgi:hypothetical protein